MVIKSVLLAAPLVLCWHNAVAIQCPPMIQVQESLHQGPVPGWTEGEDPSPRYLEGVSFFDGPPARGSSLAPDEDLDGPGKGQSLAIWSFTPVDDTPIWLSCRYAGTGVTLSRPLPISTLECHVSYGPGNVVLSIDCRSGPAPGP